MSDLKDGRGGVERGRTASRDLRRDDMRWAAESGRRRAEGVRAIYGNVRLVRCL